MLARNFYLKNLPTETSRLFSAARSRLVLGTRKLSRVPGEKLSYIFHFTCSTVRNYMGTRYARYSVKCQLASERLGDQQPAHSIQHTAHSIQHTAHSIQHTAHSIQHTAHSTQHTAHSTQHTAYSTQHTAHSTQHTAHSTQHTAHTAHSTQNTAHSTQHTAHSTQQQQCSSGR